MGFWSLPWGFTQTQTNVAGDGVYGVSITNNGVAHTKPGSYTTLLASTNFEAQMIAIIPSQISVNTVNSSALLDVAIGAAASETIIIPNLGVGYSTSLGASKCFIFPLRIPAGSRISGRTQGAQTAGACSIAIYLFGAPSGVPLPFVGSSVIDYGTVLASSRGTLITALNGSKSVWVSIGTTTAIHRCLIVAVQGGDQTTMNTFQNFSFDVGIVTGAEQIIIPDVTTACGATEYTNGPWPPLYCFNTPLPSGSQIRCRAQSHIGNGGTLDYTVYGVI